MSEGRYRATVIVRLLPEVVDPEGSTIQAGLKDLGFGGVSWVRSGKLIEVELSASSAAEAEAHARAMAEKLLANPVIEQFEIHVQEVAEASV